MRRRRRRRTITGKTQLPPFLLLLAAACNRISPSALPLPQIFNDLHGEMWDSGCSASPLFVNCYFFDNAASNLGGVVYISEGRPVFEDCVFLGNLASSVSRTLNSCACFVLACVTPQVFDPAMHGFDTCWLYRPQGGAVYVRGGEPTFTRCLFYENVAELDGGAFSINGQPSPLRAPSCVVSPIF